MFSVRQKREIADKVQRVLRETEHPELPGGEIEFTLHVKGAESWSWADIMNNGRAQSPWRQSVERSPRPPAGRGRHHGDGP